MGSEKRKATKTAILRLTADEKLRLKDAAADAGLAVGTFVKQCLNNSKPGVISRGESEDKGGKRDQVVALRFTPEQHILLINEAESTELSASEYMRYRVFGYRLPAVPEGEQLIKEVMRTLGLAKHIHNISEASYSDITADIVSECRKLTVMLMRGFVSNEYAAVFKLREAGKDVIKAQSSALGCYWPETEEALQVLLFELVQIKGELQ